MLYKKYTPVDIKGVLGLNSAYNSTKSWISSWAFNKEKPGKNDFLIISGPSGSGKTMILDMIVNELGFETMFFNPGEAGNAEKMEQIKQTSLFSKGKVVVVDEPKSIRGLTDIIKESRFPVVILTNNLYKPQLMNHRRKATVVSLIRARYDSIASMLGRISEAEDLGFSKDELLNIAKSCRGDVRAALLDLESASLDSRIGGRDVDENVFDTLKILFKSFDEETIKNAVKSCDKPINELFWWIENNIYRAYSKPQEIAEAYEYLALADMYNSYIMKRQNFSLMKYLFDFAVMGVAFSKKPAPSSFSFVRYMPPMIRTKSKKMNPVLNKIAIRTHTTTKKAVSYIPIVQKLAKLDKEKVMFDFGFDKDDMKLLK
ncbi:hypothetical protein CL614_04330 [archaeon]|nr:hypothetical protein [archaeon]|tara:strand:- start:1431 stop:2549 length:1119 start_codon:yes stop_codon:yes gene_type:complete